MRETGTGQGVREAADQESAFLGHRIGSAFGTGGYRSYSIWKLKSSFLGTWADVCFYQAVFIPISTKKKVFLPASLM